MLYNVICQCNIILLEKRMLNYVIKLCELFKINRNFSTRLSWHMVLLWDIIIELGKTLSLISQKECVIFHNLISEK